MDSTRFDAITKTLAAAGSRRAALQALATGAFATGLGRLALDDVAAKCVNPGKKCKRKHGKKKKCCGGAKCKGKRCQCPGGRAACGKACCAQTATCAGATCRPCDACASGCPSSNLQEAIAAASAGDTLLLCAETYPGIITITTDLTLRGAGDGTDGTILDGQESGPVVRINPGHTVQLEGLRITGGVASDGGGIFNAPNATLTLTDSSVTDNFAAVNGGGIVNTDGATLIVTDSRVTDNEAEFGGGISNGGTLTLTDSRVTDNEAGTDGGGIINGGTLTLNGTTTIADNDPNQCVDVGGGSGCP